MKTKDILLTVSVLATLATATAVPAQGDAPPDPAQMARGAQAWSDHCGRCHNVRAPDEKQDYEWDISVNHMRLIGNLPGQTAEDIKAFLKSSN